MRKILGVEIWKWVYDILAGVGLGLLIGSIYTCNWLMTTVDLIIIANIILTRRLISIEFYMEILRERLSRLQTKIANLETTDEE